MRSANSKTLRFARPGFAALAAPLALFAAAFAFSSAAAAQGILIDHHCTDLSKIPNSYIQSAKTQFRIWYGHTSHGSQITSGMHNIAVEPFTYNSNGSSGALSYQEGGGDLGHTGDLTWAQTTRDVLNASGNNRNLIMWSWCGGVSDNTVEGINAYLNAMNQLELDYPAVKFVYMTGHLDGSGTAGNLNLRNNQIRDYCRANNKTLFDFADIESYNPSGEYFLDREATDGCEYDNWSKNWATEWCAANPGSPLCSWCGDCGDCAHSQNLNCNLKGRAFWWMMARMAGWDGAPTATLTPTATPLPTSTPLPSDSATIPPTLTPSPSLEPSRTPTPTRTPTPCASCTVNITPVIVYPPRDATNVPTSFAFIWYAPCFSRILSLQPEGGTQTDIARDANGKYSVSNLLTHTNYYWYISGFYQKPTNPWTCDCCEREQYFAGAMAMFTTGDGPGGTLTPTPSTSPSPSPSAPAPSLTLSPTPSRTPSATPLFTLPPSPPVGPAPCLSTLMAACKYLQNGDIPSDSFLPPAYSIYVAPSGGNDEGHGTINAPFATLHQAVIYANEHSTSPTTIYLRGGIHYYKSHDAAYLMIFRSNLYITAYPGEDVVIRPWFWPANPTDWGEERAFDIAGSFSNITFDRLRFEGWSVVFGPGSLPGQEPMRNIVFKNITASDFRRRNGQQDFIRVFLETGYPEGETYPGGSEQFTNPETAHYQIENMILSNVVVQDADMAVNIGDETDANVRGLRIHRLEVQNPSSAPGGGFADALAIVNCHKVMIDHCRILNCADDAIDAKSYNVSIINSYVTGSGGSAVKCWRDAEIINCILYNVTAIDDGAIISQRGPLRIVHSALVHHPIGYAGTFAYDAPSTLPLEIVNSVFGDAQDFFVGTGNFTARSNRFFQILNGKPLVSGIVSATDAAALNALPGCSGNDVTENFFVNPAQGDFRLRAGCSWIDAGAKSGVMLPTYDFLGAPRISGAAPDIGPIEYTSGPPRTTLWMMY